VRNYRAPLSCGNRPGQEARAVFPCDQFVFIAAAVGNDRQRAMRPATPRQLQSLIDLFWVVVRGQDHPSHCTVRREIDKVADPVAHSKPASADF